MSKPKPINYIYNKKMLCKIQLLSKGERTNEMEIKNYAEELDSINLELLNKKKKIFYHKNNAVINTIFSNKSL